MRTQLPSPPRLVCRGLPPRVAGPLPTLEVATDGWPPSTHALTDRSAPPCAPVLEVPAAVAPALAAAPSARALVADGPAECLCEITVGLAAISAHARAVAVCRPSLSERPAAGELFEGCLRRTPLAVVVERPSGERVAAHAGEELAAALTPIETERDALALVAIVAHLWDPATDRAERDAETFGWSPMEPMAALEVEREGDGFVVRWPWVPRCGCFHPMLRRTLEVRRDGGIRELVSEAVLMAAAARGPCID